MVSPSIRLARLQRPGSAWTATSSASRLGCWMLGSAVGCWVEEWCRCRAFRKGLNHTTSVEYVAPLITWEAYRPEPELERYPANPARHSSSGVAKQGTGARSVPGSPPQRPRSLLQWPPHHRVSPAPAPFLSAKAPPPPERKGARYLLPARFESRESIVLTFFQLGVEACQAPLDVGPIVEPSVC